VGALGFYLSQGSHFSSFRNRPPDTDYSMVDQYFGTVIIILGIIQAIFGWYHHRRFVQDRPTRRRWFTHVHLWLGRALILCGSVNCGFGFPLSNADFKWAVIWWIVCGVFAVIYICLYILLECLQVRKSRRGVIGEHIYEGMLKRGIRDPKSSRPPWDATRLKGYSLQQLQPNGEKGIDEQSRSSCKKLVPNQNVSSQLQVGKSGNR
jgi:hypothetical protein